MRTAAPGEDSRDFFKLTKPPIMIYKFDKSVNRFVTRDQYIDECLGGYPNPYALGEQWDEMEAEQIETDYDSEADTLKHIKRVNELLVNASIELLKRSQVHDNSKLGGAEKPLFDIYTPKLKECTYGSDDYKQYLQDLKVALDHHYKMNPHHPEHYENGVNGMDLFDLIEMFFDWKAATERHADGDIYKSIEINKDRFSLSDQVCDIFRNTIKSTFE